ncbi:uncharacterized protein B0T23DRAFT_422944 [Neurospora hispaniola]|uniref:Uncharacterized protein n=1 Tax=Neurospora hispaniola TaxID=588809 RepID=A0AAJ0MNV2_9PEZI|nr:hypothetical protein B0T23DRAFT_422944 [Neurospora hispaniola]
MHRLTRRPSESCPPDPAHRPRSEISSRHDDGKSYRSHRRQSSPALTHRRRESQRNEDHKDDPESEFDPRDVYYLTHPLDPNRDKDEEKSQWDLDLEAGDAMPIKQKDGHDEDARSTRSRGRTRRPSTIGTLSPRTRSPVDRSRRQSVRPGHGTGHHRREPIRSRPRREPDHETSDSETAISPRTRRRRVNRSPTPPHRGSVIHDVYYPRPRRRFRTTPYHHLNYTDDEREEDTYHNNYPRSYHRRAHSNPPSTSYHHQSRRPSLNLATLKSSPKTASLLKAASRALEAGAATALKLRKDSPSTPLFSAQSGSKIAAAALGAAVVDGLIEHEQRRHPKLMRKGGLRHHVVKQVVQRGVAGLVGGILEEGLAGGNNGDGGDEKGEGRQKGGRSGRKESVKRVAKGMVRDYEKWEKGQVDDGKGTGGKEEKAGKIERGRRESREERERDTGGEERRRERTRERERGREETVRGRRR